MTIAETILSQLGGNRFIAMTGASNLLGRPDGLSFKIGRNAKGITHIRINLDPSDTYTVEFLKIRGTKVAEFTPAEMVYADNLAGVVSERTGLAVSL